MKSPKVFIYFLSVVILFATSCKSCKNKFSKEQPVAKEVSAYEDSAYAGLATDTATSTSNVDATSTNNATTNTSTASDATASSDASAIKSSDNTSSNDGKKMASEVEKESEQKYSSKRKRGVSSSIYDGVNDQEERYVIRKAEGYNDAYYIDDYNGTNKFYEDHYKNASKLDKPIESYIDKSMNLPSSAYAKGVTQKSVDASMPKPIVEEPKKNEVPKASGTGSIGIPKKTSTTKLEKPKNAQEMLNKKQ
ncbi:MAG: hypothetical protein RL065_1396 [Bacteroidota bacterium]|jgi:hypothetical protein